MTSRASVTSLPGKVLAGVLETALNRCLALSPETARRLADLHGKVIAVEVRGTGKTFYLTPGHAGIQVHNVWTGPVDTTISGSPLALLRLQTAPERVRALFGGAMDISGDVETARQLRAILDAVDIDWEEQMSHVMGDVAAHQLGNVVRAAQGWSKEAIRTLERNVAEYLQEEAGLVARRYEVEEFIAAVDGLRMDVDRLELRVRRLSERLAGHRSGV